MLETVSRSYAEIPSDPQQALHVASELFESKTPESLITAFKEVAHEVAQGLAKWPLSFATPSDQDHRVYGIDSIDYYMCIVRAAANSDHDLLDSVARELVDTFSYGEPTIPLAVFINLHRATAYNKLSFDYIELDIPSVVA